MTHIVLVHGAWHGAWCWRKLAPALEAEGFTPLAIDLPGHGARAGEPQTLAGYAEAVAETLRRLDEPAVLLGHSLGGQVISAAAELEPARISTLVYLAAFLGDGASVFSLAAQDGESVLGRHMKRDGDGRFVIAEDGLKDALYDDCDEADIAFARANLVPQSPEPFAAETVLTPARFGSVRRAYIVCDQDRAIGPARQGELADRQGVARRGVLHASHSPFFSVPAELAALIRDMA